MERRTWCPHCQLRFTGTVSAHRQLEHGGPAVVRPPIGSWKGRRRVLERTYTTENGGGWREVLSCGHVVINASCVWFGQPVKGRVCDECLARDQAAP